MSVYPFYIYQQTQRADVLKLKVAHVEQMGV